MRWRLLQHFEHAVLRTFRVILDILEYDDFLFSPILKPALHCSYLIDSRTWRFLSKREEVRYKMRRKPLYDTFCGFLIPFVDILHLHENRIDCFRVSKDS